MLALRLTGGQQADAEDAVQETWIRATRSLGNFRWQSSLRTWLCGILINCCREILRRRAPHVAADAIEEIAAAAVPHAPAAHAAHGALDLEAHVRALPDGARQILVLHDVEGYTHEEIAVLLDIEPGTSKSQLSRARAALRERLGATHSDSPRSKGVTP